MMRFDECYDRLQRFIAYASGAELLVALIYHRRAERRAARPAISRHWLSHVTPI